MVNVREHSYLGILNKGDIAPRGEKTGEIVKKITFLCIKYRYAST